VILRRGVVVELGATAKVFGNPQHPYTKLLLESVPQLGAPWAPRTELPAGDGADGALVEVEQDHLVAVAVA
jgi:peptide/nickel transport system ATP-binding protein